jgi:hypothetical protein
MDISYLSIFFFSIITILYYMFPSIGKHPITMTILKNNDFESYYKKNLSRLGLYFLVIVVSQFGINSLYLINKCGGSAGTNVGVAALLTFIPWILIFGIMIALLIVYPGLKSAFSDVIGYFVVAGKSNDILTSILVDVNVDESLEQVTDVKEKGDMKKTAQAILKLCGNKSILINQMTPENFLPVWDTLKPLMKTDISDIDQKQEDLLKLVVLRDNIGEGMWYFYTAILLSSIISFNLATRGCRKSLDDLKASHDAYLKTEQNIQDQKDLNNSTVMTLSSG